MTETREAATMMHARGVKRTRKAQERSRQNGTVSVPSRSWNGWRRCRYWNTIAIETHAITPSLLLAM